MPSILNSISKPLVKAMLEYSDSTQVDWSTQGLGMMRCYLGENLRLHIWSDEQKAEGASELHTHPWDFESLVVAGRVHNERFTEGIGPEEVSHLRGEIFCGEGGGLTDKAPVEVRLRRYPAEIYSEGDIYSQKALEIHRSRPETGTVTIIRRYLRPGADADHAYVYWPAGEEWVTAEPRPATGMEVEQAIRVALETWF